LIPHIKRNELWLTDGVAFGGKYLTVSKSHFQQFSLCDCTSIKMSSI
jgi:hypothetical protein